MTYYILYMVKLSMEHNIMLLKSLQGGEVIFDGGCFKQSRGH